MEGVNVVVIFLATFVISAFVAHVLKVFSKRGLPKGPWGVPLLGSLPFLGNSVPKTFYKWWKKYGNIFCVKLGSMNITVFSGYETIKAAAEFDNDAFSSRPAFVSVSIVREVNEADDISLCPFGKTYLNIRKVIARSLRIVTDNYSSSSFHGLLLEETENLCRIISQEAKHQRAISLDTKIQYAASAVIFQLLFGGRKNPEDMESNVKEFIKISNEFEKLGNAGNALDVMPWLRYFMPSQLAKMTQYMKYQIELEEKQVSEHRDMFNENTLGDVTDHFLKFEKENLHTEDGTVLSKCLFRSLKDLFAAGYSTTSSTIQWLILYMVSFPIIQEKVHKEIDQVNGDTSIIAISDCKRMHYVMATINEILRITSIGPFGLPHMATRDVNFMDVYIEKDTPIYFNIYSINHDENTWGDPNTFRPERLLDTEGKLDENKCRQIVAFGLGRRKCVGERVANAEIFIMFCTLMKYFLFLKPEDEVLDLTPVPGVVYRPKPYRVMVRERLPSSN